MRDARDACQRCQFYSAGTMQCRRNAPLMGDKAWPRTGWDAWCGEFRANDTPTLAQRVAAARQAVGLAWLRWQLSFIYDEPRRMEVLRTVHRRACSVLAAWLFVRYPRLCRGQH